MPDWQDSAELTRDTLFLDKILHVCFGCAIWEFISQLYYEWDVYRRKRQYRWTIWVYASCRLSMLVAFMLDIAAIDGGTRRQCTTLYVTAMALSYVSMALSSLLIVLRIVAIWKKQNIIVVVSYLVWISCIALNIHDMTQLRSSYHMRYGACLPYNTHAFLPNSVGILVSDTVLFGLMLAGILRIRRDALKDGISRVLYRQGIMWLIVAILVEAPVVALAILDYNDPLISMLQPIELVSLGICAGRMYRGLMSYVYEPDASIHVVTPDATHCHTRFAIISLPFMPTSYSGSLHYPKASSPKSFSLDERSEDASHGGRARFLSERS